MRLPCSQNTDDLSKYPRFYWGKARLYDNRDSYNILFEHYLILNHRKVRPSIYVSYKIIEQAFCRKLMEKKFMALSGSNIYCFVYAKPYFPPKSKSKGKNYINFWINNLDWLEIEEF